MRRESHTRLGEKKNKNSLWGKEYIAWEYSLLSHFERLFNFTFFPAIFGLLYYVLIYSFEFSDMQLWEPGNVFHDEYVFLFFVPFSAAPFWSSFRSARAESLFPPPEIQVTAFMARRLDMRVRGSSNRLIGGGAERFTSIRPQNNF